LKIAGGQFPDIHVFRHFTTYRGRYTKGIDLDWLNPSAAVTVVLSSLHPIQLAHVTLSFLNQPSSDYEEGVRVLEQTCRIM
jgi:hypothetical protein